MSRNVGPSATTTDRALFKAFDRLPAELRRAIANAPFDYAVTPLLRDLNAHVVKVGRVLAVDACLAEWTRAWSEALAIEAFAIYGIEHPQAKLVPREVLREMRLCKVHDDHQAWRKAPRNARRARARRG